MRSFGAVGDGVHDDLPAFTAAFASLAASGGGVLRVPSGDFKIVQTSRTILTAIPPNVTVQGDGSTSRIVLCSDGPGYRELFRVEGDGIRLQDIELTRGDHVSGVMVTVFPSSDFSMDRVVIDGRNDSLGPGMHGIQFAGPDGAAIRRMRLTGCTLQNLDFGLFQANEARTVVQDVAVSNCTFRGNAADDLEFNAPSGIMTNVTVVGSNFLDNRSRAHWAGFGVGLANVQVATIAGNTFSGYPFEPIHIEDRSSDVVVAGNTFANTSTTPTEWSSQIFVISGSRRVSILNNTFDMTANTNPVVAVYAGAGGTSATPADITVSGNTFRPGREGAALRQFDVSGLVFANNRYVGDGLTGRLAAVAVAPGIVDVRLQPIQNATDYQVQRNSNAGGWVEVGTLGEQGGAMRDLSALPGGESRYRVIALYPGGQSDPSEERIVRVPSAEETVIADGFGGSLASQAWTPYRGRWSSTGGVFSQVDGNYGDPKKALLNTPDISGDVEILAKVRVDFWASGDHARAGVGLATSPDGRGYNLVFHEVNGDRGHIQFLDDGLRWGNAYEFAWLPGVWYWFRLKSESGVLYGKVWAEGMPEPTSWPYMQEGWSNRASGVPSLNGGSAGSGGSTVSFDDVLVTRRPGSAGAGPSLITLDSASTSVLVVTAPGMPNTATVPSADAGESQGSPRLPGALRPLDLARPRRLIGRVPRFGRGRWRGIGL